MSYFADGARVALCPDEDAVVCVGWLDSEHPRATGEVSERFVAALSRACQRPVQVTRGWYRCPLCGDGFGGAVVHDGEDEFLVGHAEIRVAGPDGVTFASPDMVIPYVRQHGHRPPDAFRAAVVEADGRECDRAPRPPLGLPSPPKFP